MVIAALVSFGALFVAWIFAPSREAEAADRSVEMEVRPAIA